jgi:hypothetical protein
MNERTTTNSGQSWLGPEIAGALARFWSGGAGPSHATISTAMSLAGYEEPPDASAGNKEQRVLFSLRRAPQDTSKALAEEFIGALRAAGYFDQPRPETEGLHTAFSRRGFNLSPEGFVDWSTEDQQGGLSSVSESPTRAEPLPTEPTVTEVAEPNLELLINIFQRLAFALRPLVDRRRGRPGLTMQDEYDLQDAVEALLRSLFADVRPEERTPSYAGSSSTMDFLLKSERLAIEVKVTRQGRGEKQIKPELLIDMNDYKEHPNVETLVILIYDLASTFRNPAGFENDFNGRHGELDVRVLVVGWPLSTSGQ